MSRTPEPDDDADDSDAGRALIEVIFLAVCAALLPAAVAVLAVRRP